MTDRVILANAELVLPGAVMRGSVELAGGTIRRVDAGGGIPAGAIDCEGDLVMPGLIELHTDNLERHLKPRPGVDWPQAAAILAHDAEVSAVGITTVFDALRVGALETRAYGAGEYARGVADQILAAHQAGALRVSHRLHLRAEVCSETLTRELEGFGPGDRVGIVSLMDHTPGQRQFADIAIFRHYVRGKHGFSEEEFLDHLGRQQELGDAMRAPHEAAAVAAARRLGAVLASHDDTTEAHVAASVRHGAAIAEFPTSALAARASHAAGIAVMMGAPNLLRGGSHSG
ncbi:MAG: alpha-D-ribose 1-methylphosphonate 5-triphosphate diphosphatase, partial [Rhodobacteraceae bacterium]|nr:alpha-D-ribose 1-methylphosphonate 5-triphosphate diphosphatase [Paracoccaceae bacterium]